MNCQLKVNAEYTHTNCRIAEKKIIFGWMTPRLLTDDTVKQWKNSETEQTKWKSEANVESNSECVCVCIVKIY